MLMVLRNFGVSLIFLFVATSTAYAQDCQPPGELLRKSVLQPNRIATGGFEFDLKIFSRFATFSETVSNKQLDELIKRHDKQITAHPYFRRLLKEVLQDKYVFETFKVYMESGSHFLAIKAGARYFDVPHVKEAGNVLHITVGIESFYVKPKDVSLEIKKTILHELLHYVFDKMDLEISETQLEGVPDHDLIEALEERFLIISLIRQGDMPSEAILPGLRATELVLHFQDLTFAERYVVINSNSLRSEESLASGFNSFGEGFYVYSKEQIRDFRKLWMLNGALIEGARKLAQQFNPKKPHKAFEKKEAQAAFASYVEELAQSAESCSSL